MDGTGNATNTPIESSEKRSEIHGMNTPIKHYTRSFDLVPYRMVELSYKNLSPRYHQWYTDEFRVDEDFVETV